MNMVGLATRRVDAAGGMGAHNEALMLQRARGFTEAADGLLRVTPESGRRSRHTKVKGESEALLANGGAKAAFTPPKSPNGNAYA